jgi:hypothetical protein
MVNGQLHNLSRFTPQEKSLGTYWIGGWVGPRAGLIAVEKIKFSTTAGGVEPRPFSPVPRYYTIWAIPGDYDVGWQGDIFRTTRSWPTFRYYPVICMDGLRKSKKIISQSNLCAAQDLNPVLPGYNSKPASSPLSYVFHPLANRLSKGWWRIEYIAWIEGRKWIGEPLKQAVAAQKRD